MVVVFLLFCIVKTNAQYTSMAACNSNNDNNDDDDKNTDDKNDEPGLVVPVWLGGGRERERMQPCHHLN